MAKDKDTLEHYARRFAEARDAKDKGSTEHFALMLFNELAPFLPKEAARMIKGAK